MATILAYVRSVTHLYYVVPFQDVCSLTLVGMKSLRQSCNPLRTWPCKHIAQTFFHDILGIHEVCFPILASNSGTQMFQNTNILESLVSASVILHQAMVGCRSSIGGVHEHIILSPESVDAVKVDVGVESFSNHFLWTCSNAKSGICVNFLLDAD